MRSPVSLLGMLKDFDVEKLKKLRPILELRFAKLESKVNLLCDSAGLGDKRREIDRIFGEQISKLEAEMNANEKK